MSVGENFRFGHGAEGDADLLRLAAAFDDARRAAASRSAGETVSSTHIRGLVAAGDVAQAGEFLGGPFMLEGEVVERRRARARARDADREHRARTTG